LSESNRFGSPADTGELEKEDKKLIILMELEKYYKENNGESVRYSQLRDLSDEALNEFSGGFQTNFGGAFEIYVKEFEKQGYLKRVRKSPGKTLITPYISKIENSLDKKRLKNSFDEMDVKAIYETPFAEEPLLRGGIMFTHDSVPNHLIKSVARDDDDLQGSISLLSVPWKIYTACEKKNFQLSEETVQKLLTIGKTIASKNKKVPFKVILEYNGLT
jgi:hypothetical protein